MRFERASKLGVSSNLVARGRPKRKRNEAPGRAADRLSGSPIDAEASRVEKSLEGGGARGR